MVKGGKMEKMPLLGRLTYAECKRYLAGDMSRSIQAAPPYTSKEYHLEMVRGCIIIIQS